MARIVLVLICGALVFILVSKFAPHFIETYLPGVISGSTETASEVTDSKKPAAAAPGKKNTTAPKPKSGTGAVPAATASTATTEFTAPRALPAGLTGTVQSIQTPAGSARPTARVTAENATLYLTNTSVGPVVGRLTKGAVVEPVFVVSTAGQNWTFVNAGDHEIAGFLRSDTLTKVKPAESSR